MNQTDRPGETSGHPAGAGAAPAAPGLPAGSADAGRCPEHLSPVALSDAAEIEAIAAWMAKSPAQVRAAIGYYIELRDEIDAWVGENEALAERYRAAWRAERGLPPE